MSILTLSCNAICVIRKSLEIVVWTIYSFFSKNCQYSKTQKWGTLRIVYWQSKSVYLILSHRWYFEANPQNCAIPKICMFFSRSPLKSGKSPQKSSIDLLYYDSTELSRFYTSKLPWVDQRERWNSNFVDFTFSKIEGSFLNQSFTRWNANMSQEYHAHYTQEVSCRYLDEFLILCKEMHFYQNTEEWHLAYSY